MNDPSNNAPTLPNHNQGKKPSRQVDIWIPVLVALVTGLLGLASSISIGIITRNTTLNQMTQDQKPSPGIPQLHQSYTGETVSDSGSHNLFNLDTIVENLATGDFTARGTFRVCSAQVIGVVTIANEIFFDADQQADQQNGCVPIRYEFKGKIDSSGEISGKYEHPNPQTPDSANNGTWHVA